MSKEALAEFMSRLAQDADLQDGLRGLAEGDGDDSAVSTDAFVGFAHENGFEFTVEEALGAFELSDDELDSVSGGGVFVKGEISRGSLLGNKAMPTYKELPLSLLYGNKAFKFF